MLLPVEVLVLLPVRQNGERGRTEETEPGEYLLSASGRSLSTSVNASERMSVFNFVFFYNLYIFKSSRSFFLKLTTYSIFQVSEVELKTPLQTQGLETIRVFVVVVVFKYLFFSC